MTRFEILYLISQYLIFVTGLIYAVVAYRQLRAIGRQADIASQTLTAMRNVERPFLLVRSQKIAVQDEDSRLGLASRKRLNISFDLINTGKGPAMIKTATIMGVLSEGYFDRGTPDEQKTPVFGNVWLGPDEPTPLQGGKEIIAPDNSSSYRGTIFISVLDWDRIEVTRTVRLRILVSFHYEDVFREQMSETIIFEYAPPLTTAPAGSSGGLFVVSK